MTRYLRGFVFLCVLSAACAPDKNQALCGGGGSLAENQRGSMMAPIEMGSLPAEVVIDSNFDSTSSTEIQLAIAEWNRVGRGLIGSDFFRITHADIPGGVRSARPQDCGADYGGAGRFYVVRETSMTQWAALGFGDRNPGVTVRCSTERQVTSQIVFLNSQIIPNGQMRSVALHELGHTLGLDHSCANSNPSSTFVSCNGLSASHAYRIAVMYPQLSAGASGSSSGPERKESLRENDIERAQCHYNKNR